MEPLNINTSAMSTPSSSPGLFSPSPNTPRQALPQLSDGTPHQSPYLHPLQGHKVKETHKANVDQDFITGRKLINQYEIINEIGRGVHGKVKLARSLETGEFVAIKIIQRFSKKRKLGRVTVSPEDKTKREIAILKKIRHANVVGLLEVIDDPELKKIYMVLEHVELGEIVWRKKGNTQICIYERRRIEREQKGEKENGEGEKHFQMLQRRRERKEVQRAKLTQLRLENSNNDYWSLEHGNDEDEDAENKLTHHRTHESLHTLSHSASQRSTIRSNPGSRAPSRAPSAAASRTSSRAHTPLPTELDIPALDSDNEDDEPGPLMTIHSNHGSSSALEGTYWGSYPDEPAFRGRSPSMADSVISHMSSLDGLQHDAFEDDFSYVPCFTIDQARSAFRDTVLGLEYLHYEGIVHRDIKPANLLWTKCHRVKISDFGVSYFGRPIREGETEENISEADATDFDDDLELAKTVGTPAFFAPELCYTDLDVEQPKVTEQIDVWSLGITLYCLIYARIPFLADDEYQLFRCIAKEDVYIPRRRLKAVDPNINTPQQATIKRVTTTQTLGPYREESELAYEEIDDELYDLLKRMLRKDPLERMKLREVKRHPWVLRGIDNIIGWLDDTDPSRKTAGRRIQVDRNELERAVVPITFLERARSAVKKAVGKVIGVTRSETRGEGSRRRAASNATSSHSGNDTQSQFASPITPGLRDTRRPSLRGDESIFAALANISHHHREQTEHPLAQSETASPDALVLSDPFAQDFASQTVSVGGPPSHVPSGTSDPDSRPGPPDRAISTAGSIQTIRGHAYSRSVTTPNSATVIEDGPKTPGPFTDHMGAIFGGHLWHRGRDMADIEESTTSRARSVDRSLFESDCKHAEPTVGISSATAPGLFQHPLNSPITLKPARRMSRSSTKSADLSPKSRFDKPLPSPQFFQSHIVAAYQQSASSPDVRTGYAASDLDNRPATANKTPEAKTPAPRVYGSSTPESFGRAKETLERRRRLENDTETKRHSLANIDGLPQCPPSPDDDIFMRKQEDAKRAQSSSSMYSTGMASQITSPSDVTSPISSVNLGSQERIFTSDPSLPALISSRSSVSGYTESDVPCPEHIYLDESAFSSNDTSDTLTPPSLPQQASDEGQTPIATPASHSVVAGDQGYRVAAEPRVQNDDDSDSDSDEGLTMTRRKPKVRTHMGSHSITLGRLDRERRDTNASVGSAETAKKIVMDGSNLTPTMTATPTTP